jgi:hypothetical protein
MCAFSNRFLVRYRERLICMRLSNGFLLRHREPIMYKAQRSVFITASGAWALSDGLLVRHRERSKIFCFYSSKFTRIFVSSIAPIGCDRINSRLLKYQ